MHIMHMNSFIYCKCNKVVVSATYPLAGISVDLLSNKNCDCCCRLCAVHSQELLCVV